MPEVTDHIGRIDYAVRQTTISHRAVCSANCLSNCLRQLRRYLLSAHKELSVFASRLFKGWDAATSYLINATGQEFLYRMIFAATMIYMITVAGLNPLQLVLVGTVLEGTIFIFEVPT